MCRKSETGQREIEVTPEMIEAGGQVIYSHPSLCDDGWDELAVEVYEAMETARRRGAACSSAESLPRPVKSSRQALRS